MFAYTRTLTIQASYSLPQGGFECQTEEVQLPAGLFLAIVDSSKDATFKLVLNLSEDLGSLLEMFRDLPVRGKVTGSTYSFQLPNTVIASIVLAKSSSRIRLQSEFFEGLCFLLKELHARAGAKLQVDQIPLEEYVLIFDEHFRLTKQLRALEAELQADCNNFTAVEQHLVARFKQKLSLDNSSL
jgi:hypothetical protein